MLTFFSIKSNHAVLKTERLAEIVNLGTAILLKRDKCFNEIYLMLAGIWEREMPATGNDSDLTASNVEKVIRRRKSARSCSRISEPFKAEQVPQVKESEFARCRSRAQR